MTTRRIFAGLALFFGSASRIESLIPESVRQNPDLLRRYRLIISFHRLGVVFGLAYALFYFALGFISGSLIIGLTVIWMGATWPILIYKRSPQLVANYFSLLFTIALTIMSPLQGGIHSPSIPWLAASPLVCVLIAGGGPAIFWTSVSVTISVIFVLLDHVGVVFPVRYPPGAQVWIELFGNTGLVLFVVAIALIIERTRVEAFQRLEQSAENLAVVNGNLRKLQLERDEFFSIVAHDLNNPLTTITTTSALLREYPVDPEARAASDELTRASKEMQQMVEQILQLRNVEQDQLKLRPQAVELTAFVREQIKTHQAVAHEKRIQFGYDFPSAAVDVYVDPQALAHIVGNLVSNALKYSPVDTKVTVAVEMAGEFATFTVTDQGPGIPETERDRLFQRFSRLSTPPIGRESAHGMGLFIVRKYAEASGGTVACAPFSGQGARFIVRLPVAENGAV